ncbi:MAG: nucleotidyltransferase domain-containing protein [Coriobacteriia bacterium]
MLSELLGSKTRARMIAALVVAPEQRLHLRALVRAAGGGIASVQREVERLEDLGLVTSERDARGRRQISLVADHPFAGPVAGLVAAEPSAQYGARIAQIEGLRPEVAEALGGWVDAIVTGFDPIRIVLFGSQANGTADEGSDVDLLVVLPKFKDRGRTMVDIKTAVGRRTIGLDVIPTDPEDIEAQRTASASVVRDAVEEGVTLYERSA